MGYEAIITINCEYYSNRIIDVIMLLSKLNWSFYNSDGLVEYIPIGDNDEYDWQREKISEADLKEIVDYKQDHNERVGLLFCYNGTEGGFTMTASSTKEIVLGLDYYRKTMPDNTTDFSWYFQNVIVLLRNNGCEIDYLSFDEYTD